MKKYVWLFMITILPASALKAQELVMDTEAFVPNAGHYIVAIIAGFVLAVAFSLILTNLSLAAGLETISIGTRSKNRSSNQNRSNADAGEDSENSIGENVRMISSAFGIWTLVTATISLFFASWLAAELSLTGDSTIGAVIGLVIWGLFYVAMMTIEVSALSSLVGSLIKMAAGGLRTAYNATSSMFSKSDEKKIEETALRVTNAVKEEIFGNFDTKDLKKQIQSYIDQLKPKEIDPHQIAMEFGKVLNETEIKAIATDSGYTDSETIYATLINRGLDQNKARNLASKASSIFSVIKDQRAQGKGMADSVIDSSLRIAGMSDSEIRDNRMKIENYLRSTGNNDLDPDLIKADLERLFHDPAGASRSLKERLSHISRSDIENALAENTDMSREQISARVDRILTIFNSITSAGSAGTGISDMRDKLIDRLRTSIDSLDNPDLRYDDIADDFQKLFHDPKAGAQALVNRAKSIDRDTLRTMLARRKDISEDDAERILMKFDSAKENMLNRIHQMEMEVKRRVNQAKEEALYQAEEARKTAATAAWWAFGTAVVSGIGAVLGGIIASNTF